MRSQLVSSSFVTEMKSRPRNTRVVPGMAKSFLASGDVRSFESVEVKSCGGGSGGRPCHGGVTSSASWVDGFESVDCRRTTAMRARARAARGGGRGGEGGEEWRFRQRVQGRTRPVPNSSSNTVWPGRNFRLSWFGVAAVWMNSERDITTCPTAMFVRAVGRCSDVRVASQNNERPTTTADAAAYRARAPPGGRGLGAGSG